MKEITSFFIASLFFAIGTPLLLRDDWLALGCVLWLIGIIITLLGTLSAWIAIFERKMQAAQYLFDSAKHLSDDLIDRLLYAMGLAIKVRTPTTNLAVTINTRDTYKQKNLINVPASPEQLLKLAQGLIVEGVQFSRPEWTTRRGVFSDSGFRTLKEYMRREKLIEPINPSNLNDGYRLTDGPDGGRAILEAYLPSPTPGMEAPINQAI